MKALKERKQSGNPIFDTLSSFSFNYVPSSYYLLYLLSVFLPCEYYTQHTSSMFFCTSFPQVHNIHPAFAFSMPSLLLDSFWHFSYVSHFSFSISIAACTFQSFRSRKTRFLSSVFRSQCFHPVSFGLHSLYTDRVTQVVVPFSRTVSVFVCFFFF